MPCYVTISQTVEAATVMARAPAAQACANAWMITSAMRSGTSFGRKKTCPRHGHHANIGTRLEYGTLMWGQPAIALLGMHDPRWYARFAEPLCGVVIRWSQLRYADNPRRMSGVLFRAKSARSCA